MTITPLKVLRSSIVPVCIYCGSFLLAAISQEGKINDLKFWVWNFVGLIGFMLVVWCSAWCIMKFEKHRQSDVEIIKNENDTP